MAISKAFLFEEEEQAAAEFGFAFSHPARVVILRRLMSGTVLSYDDIVSGMPIVPKTVEQHVRILERLKFIEPGLLPDNTVGFQLNQDRYYARGFSARRQLGRSKTISLHSSDQLIGGVG